MILHTSIPNEIIMPDTSKNDMAVIKYKGIMMSVKKDKNQFVTERILSTNPKDFLNKEFIPGKIINKPPAF